MAETKPFSFKKVGKPLSIETKTIRTEESIADLQSQITSAIDSVPESPVIEEEKAQVADPIGPTEQALREAQILKESIIRAYGGKKGYNPYVWVEKVLTPLIKRIKAGDGSAIKEIMDFSVDDIDCSVTGLGMRYGEDKGVFANNPRASIG